MSDFDLKEEKKPAERMPLIVYKIPYFRNKKAWYAKSIR